MKTIIITLILAFATLSSNAQEMLGSTRATVVSTLNEKGKYYKVDHTADGTAYLMTTGDFQSIYYFTESNICYLYVVIFPGAKRSLIVDTLEGEGYSPYGGVWRKGEKEAELKYSDDSECWYVSIYYHD